MRFRSSNGLLNYSLAIVRCFAGTTRPHSTSKQLSELGLVAEDNMTRILLGVLLFAMPMIAHGQDAQDAAALAHAAGCGANEVEFNVKTDKNQHPTPLPEAGKAVRLRRPSERSIGKILDPAGYLRRSRTGGRKFEPDLRQRQRTGD